MDDEVLDAARSLEELLPGIAALPGSPTEEQLGGPLFRHLRRNGQLSWSKLAAMTPVDIKDVSHVGPIRAKRVLSNLSELQGIQLARVVRSERVAAGMTDDVILDSLSGIAAWAVGTGCNGSVLDALLAAIGCSDGESPQVELQVLRSISASDIADPERVAWHDSVLAAETLIGQFDERERAILDRLLDFDGSAPKLHEIGDRFGVTAARISQIERVVQQRLASAFTEARFASLVTAADRLRTRLGAAVPADDLRSLFATYPPDLVDRLVLHLAGPYRFEGKWYVLASLGSLGEAVMSAFESAANGGVAPFDAFRDALKEVGVRDEYLDIVISDDPRLRVVDDDVVDCSGSMATRAVIALTRAGVPLRLDELGEFVQPSALQTLSKQLRNDERIEVVGLNRFALAEWDMQAFEGITPTMQQRLESGSSNLDLLAHELAEEFGVSPNSVTALAMQHPAFLVEAGVVMLRPDDRPYTPFTDLSRTRCCYVIDGAWSWRLPVDRLLLRGSGRPFPEAFAVHLGLLPLESGSVDSPVGPIKLRWAQYPTIGSLRSLAASLDAEEGDWVFVRRVGPSSIDAQSVRAADVPNDPDGALRALVGVPGASGDLEQVLAEGLGLSGTVDRALKREREVLLDRREHDLVELVDAVGVKSP